MSFWSNFDGFSHESNESYVPDSIQPVPDIEASYAREDSYVEQSNNDIPSVSFETDQDFTSESDLVNWVQRRGLSSGYVINKRRSKKKDSVVVRVWLKCDRGGVHKTTATDRRTGSKKIGCPFELIGFFDTARNAWKLQVIVAEHNHDASRDLTAHPFPRRLSTGEYELVEELYAQNMEPRNIHRAVRNKNPESLCIPKDIHNAIQKQNFEKRVGETPMQILENLLHSTGYVYDVLADQSTNVVDSIFFVHPISQTIWKAFPHVLLIDATYKTNMYNLPLIQVVGVTSTNVTFSVAFAFVTKEQEKNLSWVLTCVKSMLEDGMTPRVIVTDRDYALMNACDNVFPDASKNLCRFHIQQNIGKRWKKAFTKSEWSTFLKNWNTLCESSTPEIYEYNYNRLYKRLTEAGKKAIFEYLNDTWLKVHRERFVSAWTNRTINFGQSTTNRVESQHAHLKRYLKGSHNTLDRIVTFVGQIVPQQEIMIRKSFEDSRVKTMVHHKISLFDALRGNVSHHALDLLENEFHKRVTVLQTYGQSCGCQLFSGYGLPCACRLEEYNDTGRSIPLDAIDIFWRKLDLSPANTNGENLDVDKEINFVKTQILSQSEPVRKSLFSKIAAVLNPKKTDKKPPVRQQDTRGRPTSKVAQQRQDDAARNSSYTPSNTNYESPREGTYVPSPSKSTYDGPRHSSYVPSPSQESRITISDSKTKPPVMRRSRSKAGKKTDTTDVDRGFPLLRDGDLHNIIRFKSQLPQLFHPYISAITDVKPDGHCGFRSVALGLTMDQAMWPFIRRQLVDEMDRHSEYWTYVFDTDVPNTYDTLRRSIDFQGIGMAGPQYWMDMPNAGLLIAQAFGVVVHLLHTHASQTFFPVFQGPKDIKYHQIVTLVFVDGNHFINVVLTGEYPMPIPNALWRRYRNIEAAEWEIIYADRIRWYYDLLNPNPDRTVQYID